MGISHRGAGAALLCLAAWSSAAATAPADTGFHFSLDFQLEDGAAAVHAEGTTGLAPDGSLLFRNVTLQSGDSRVQVDGRVYSGSTPHRMSFHIRSESLDLTPFVKSAGGAAAAGGRVFSPRPLPLDFLRRWDLDLDIRIGALHLPNLVLNRVRVPVQIRGGILDAAAVQADLTGAPLSASLRMDATRNPADVNGSLELRGLKPASLPHDAARPWISGADTDISLSARGRGNSVADIMAHLDGDLLMSTGPGTVPDEFTSGIGAGVFLGVLGKLNPFSGREASQTLECAVIHLVAQDGHARTNRGIAIRTGKMTIVGSGEIDLGRETIGLGLRPYPRRGVNLNVAGFTNIARIEGTLADPQPVISPLGAIQNSAAAGAAVATAGLALLGRELLGPDDDQDACQRARNFSPDQN